MRATLTWSLSLALFGFVMALQSPAHAERAKPRRAARSAVVRHAAVVAPIAPVAPVVLVASPAGVRLAEPVASAAGPGALDVAGGCVPVWVVEGRQTRRLPDRCPRPRAPGVAPSSSGAADAVVATRVAAGAAMPAAAPAPPGAAPSAEKAASRRRAAKRKPPAKCARFRTWVDANGVRRSSPQCP